jgi:hypothetical protein
MRRMPVLHRPRVLAPPSGLLPLRSPRPYLRSCHPPKNHRDALARFPLQRTLFLEYIFSSGPFCISPIPHVLIIPTSTHSLRIHTTSHSLAQSKNLSQACLIHHQVLLCTAIGCLTSSQYLLRRTPVLYSVLYCVPHAIGYSYFATCHLLSCAPHDA